jgi:hypothetical protein
MREIVSRCPDFVPLLIAYTKRVWRHNFVNIGDLYTNQLLLLNRFTFRPANAYVPLKYRVRTIETDSMEG